MTDVQAHFAIWPKMGLTCNSSIHAKAQSWTSSCYYYPVLQERGKNSVVSNFNYLVFRVTIFVHAFIIIVWHPLLKNCKNFRYRLTSKIALSWLSFSFLVTVCNCLFFSVILLTISCHEITIWARCACSGTTNLSRIMVLPIWSDWKWNFFTHFSTIIKYSSLKSFWTI
jgi:hypothetical protein